MAQLQRVDSFQYPAAHIGHLNVSQSSALADFKKLCQDEGYYTPPSGKAQASHDDETLLRYLRARKFVPKDAWGQFKDTEDWRRKQKIEELYGTIDVDEYDETRRLYPQWTGRRDKRGIPVYVFEVAGLDSKRMSAYEASAGKAKEPGRLPPKLLRLFALYENLTRFVMPLCSAIPSRPHPETPISQSNNIVDISRVGLKQFWNLKGHMQDASQLATAHYPETLDRIFIIGAPSFFPTVWSWIKRWFDPITVSKIFILGQSEVQSTLARYMEPADIPKKYGGELDWEWGSLPALEPTIERALTWPEGEPHSFPTGPIKWRLSADGKLLEAVAVGSQDGKPREKVIASVPAFEVPSGVTLSARASIDAVVPPIAKPTSASDAGLATGVAAVSLADGPASNSDTRAGTSETRFTQQSHTLADGQLAQHTPESRDNGQGDKTTTMEPSTVGQAAKDVEVPLAQPPTEETDTSYLGQAKAAVGAAAGAATGVGASVLAAAGLGGSTETKKKDGDDTQVETKEDSRVDDMKQQEVENFIRNKYETSNQPGNKAAKE